MRGRITKRSVDALKPDASRDAYLWDTELRGFGVRVKPTGAKSFVVSYYAPGLHRVRRRLTLGAHGPVTVERARTRAADVLGRVRKGEDPARERSEARRAAEHETVARLFDDFLDDSKARLKLRTVEEYERLARLHITPALGKLPVAKATTRDVARLHHELRSRPVVANRTVALVGAFYRWLERREIFTGPNPARNVERYAETGRERFLSLEELARLGQALRVAETLGLPSAPEHRTRPSPPKRERNSGMFAPRLEPANPTAVAALRFLILTGWREREALRLRWAEIDTNAGLATLADSKTGKSIRVLGEPALNVLAAQPRTEGSPFVFPSPRNPAKPLEGIRRLWHAVRYEAGLEGVRLHDLRHTAASVGMGRGFSLYVVSKLLGHKTTRSTEKYAHLGDDIRRLAADDVSGVIAEALEAHPEAAARTNTSRGKRRA